MFSAYKTIIRYFLAWRTLLFLVAFLSTFLIPQFGARFPYYESTLEITKLPNWIWGFGNFDGVHYLRIAQRLYSDVNSQVFFPVYPLLVRAFSFVFHKTQGLDLRFFVDPSFFYSGFILSNLFFLSGLLVLYKFFRLDFDEKTSLRSIALLLVFPTSFYFGAIYTESLFLLLCVSSFYLLRQKRFLLASIVIALATATRVTGVFLVLVYLIDVFRGKISLNKLIGFIISPLGIGIYIFYLYSTFAKPFYFITSQSSFGAERLTNGIVLLPQVLFRYIFRIFPSVPVFSLSFFNAALELVFTLATLTATILFYKKMRKSYWWFTMLSLILPSLTGTLSSMPRYALSAFMVLPFIANSKYYKAVLILFITLGIVLITLFVRGYWVA